MRYGLRRGGPMGALLLVWGLSTAGEAAAQQSPSDLSMLSLEALMRIPVTAASRSEESLFRSPTAIAVITRDDIRRSGINTLPELLRLVPGVSVARIDATKWAISARGFNTNFTNKMLVLFNGRSAYNRLFGGVYWEVWDISLDEIERIEVIRGPGASLWGDNAINGVINIVTRSAFDTKGGVVSASLGSLDRGAVTARYGGGMGAAGAYRVFVKVADGNGLFRSSGQRAPDDSKRWTVGARLDRKLGATSQFSLEGASIQSDNGQIEREFSVTPGPPMTSDRRSTTQSNSVQGRWTRQFAEQGEVDVFSAFERFSHRHHDLQYGYDVTNVDVQHRLPRMGAHRATWGAAYRFTTDYVEPGHRVSISPGHVAESLLTFFVQDQVSWAKNRGQLTVGTRVGRTEFSGWGWQPSIRLLWELTPRQAVWTAASRALRTPTRGDRGLRVNNFSIPGAARPTVFATIGQAGFTPERLRSLEAGYRRTVGTRASVDLSAYWNDYQNLATQEPGAPFLEDAPMPVHLVVPSYTSNGMSARTRGLELSTAWMPARGWRVEAGYSMFTIDPRPYATSRDVDAAQFDGSTPRHQGFVRSQATFGGRLEVDANLFVVGRLPQLAVSSHTRFDMRIGWRAWDGLELSVIGQDLLKARHVEFGGLDTESVVTMIPRSVRVQATWQF